MGLRRSAPGVAAPAEVPRFSIQRLAEPLLTLGPPEQHDSKRGSDASSTAAGDAQPTPASLEADLAHYKDLFTKLRFSYTSQVSKEKFLRNLVASDSEVPTAAQNSALESTLLSLKTDLNAHKRSVADLLAALEAQARELTRRHAAVEAQNATLERLPAENEAPRKEVARLRQDLDVDAPVGGDLESGASRNEDMHLPLAATQELILQREAELAALDEQIAALGPTQERKARELARLEAELGPLEKQKITAIATANEARRRREQAQGGIADDTEERGRWLKGVEATMRSLLEVES